MIYFAITVTICHAFGFLHSDGVQVRVLGSRCHTGGLRSSSLRPYSMNVPSDVHHDLSTCEGKQRFNATIICPQIVNFLTIFAFLCVCLRPVSFVVDALCRRAAAVAVFVPDRRNPTSRANIRYYNQDKGAE